MEDLLTAVETMKNMMVARATGSVEGGQGYKALRQELLKNGLIKDRLPRFLKTCRNLDEFWAHIRDIETYVERRKYLADQFHDVLFYLESANESPADHSTSSSVERLNSTRVHELWQKALTRRETDPEGAITAARSLMESVCKNILDSSGVSYGESDDLPKLYKTVANSLSLAPSQHTEQMFKQILSGCQSVVHGLASIRNRLSDSHGPGTVYAKPSPRHAELAVNIAGSMSSFLIATWEAKSASEGA